MRRGFRVEAAGALVAGIHLRWVRPWELTWGATAEEVAVRAPGDELVRHPNVATRAVTVEAPPEAVWPWLIQIGTGRAGGMGGSTAQGEAKFELFPREGEIIVEGRGEGGTSAGARSRGTGPGSGRPISVQ